MIVAQDQSGQTIDLPVGQVMELRLPENPTTGYRWTFLTDGAPVCVVVSDAFMRSSGPPGQGGEHHWLIKGAKAGECDITMQYARSFQADSAAKTFAVHLRITR